MYVDEQCQTEPSETINENKSLPQLSASSLQQQERTKIVTNLCMVCSERRRALAFVPCGHFTACVICGHSLKSCPACGSIIKGLLRIYDWIMYHFYQIFIIFSRVCNRWHSSNIIYLANEIHVEMIHLNKLCFKKYKHKYLLMSTNFIYLTLKS